jgi:hypothetical protein
MSISLSQSSSVAANATSGAEFLTAAVSKSQQELEGKMALQLIQSASPSNLPTPTGNSGFQVNIKV